VPIHALRCAVRLRATPASAPPIRKTIAFAESVKAADYAGAGERTVSLSWVPGKIIRGEDYLLHVAMPNIFFHIAMAYAILRHNGVDIGKMDFLGSMNFVRAGAASPGDHARKPPLPTDGRAEGDSRSVRHSTCGGQHFGSADAPVPGQFRGDVPARKLPSGITGSGGKPHLHHQPRYQRVTPG
jgi:hypothetical protein